MFNVIMGNTLKSTAAGGTDNIDLTPPDGQHDGFSLFIQRPTNVTGAHTPATADLVAFLNAAIAYLTTEERIPKALRQVLPALSGAELRELHRWATGQEVWNDFVGVAKAINPADTWRVRIFIPLAIPAAAFKSRVSRRPGATQLRAINLKVVEGAAAINANATRAAGTMSVDIEYQPIPGPDQHVPLLSVIKDTSPRRDSTGPDGLTLVVYQNGTAAAASALTAYTAKVDGQQVVNVQTVQSVVRAYAAAIGDAGRANINDAETVVYAVPFGTDVERAASGKVVVEEAKSDISPWDLRYINVPARDELMAKAFVAFAAQKYGRRVLLTQDPIGVNDDPGSAAYAPAVIIPETDARFSTLPGLVGVPMSDTVAVVVPAELRKRLEGMKGTREADDSRRRVRKAATLMVPGSTGTDGNVSGGIGQQLAGI